MSGITVRDARYSELPEIANVMAKAFWDDNLFGEHIHPHRDEYPDDFDLYWLRRARVNFWDYRFKFLVAVTKNDDDREMIVGVAQWSRLGEGGKKLECWSLDPRNLLMPMSAAAMKVHALIWPNRACDPAREDIIERSYPCFKGVWSGDRAESWYLEALTIRPDYQGKSVGRQLVHWGLNKAEEEGVVASVISSWKMDGFYTRCGFEEQYGNATHGEGNPLAGIEGANMYWRWPKGCK
ncbi:hypothetical protein NLG97_g1135 [Lecanicillium saksenae]|uniref:Uncharacterized protein n=1 Tax=Lecanicillium saksenae TaxID=468837 RepID=A0ACC1R6D5_9HYPO|nr:hypothetical protein NLG97_g1135 [Lecanicillium saksenae]